MTDYQKNYRRKIARIQKRIAAGEPHKDIAARFNLTPERIRQIAVAIKDGSTPPSAAALASTAPRKKAAAKPKPTRRPTHRPTPRPIPHADFRKLNATQARFSLEDVTAALAFGRVSEILKSIARQAGVSETVLAGRVGTLLQGG